MVGPSAFWVMRKSDNLCFNGLGPVGGNGAYWNYSGVERKRDIEDYRSGIAEIRALRPVRFTRVAPPDVELPNGQISQHVPRREVGFVAQEIETVIPEAVASLEDIGLAMDTTPIIAALVNAFKELDTRVHALEGTSAP